MNDFDRFLEIKLRLLLDEVVAVRPPARERRPARSDRVVPITRVTGERPR